MSDTSNNTELKVNRTFLPADFKLEKWQDLEPFFKRLQERDLSTEENVQKYLGDLSELEAFISENMAWRYIKMTIDTRDEERKNSYIFFVNEIQPHLSREFHQLNKKLYESTGIKSLDKEYYKIPLRSLAKDIELFREENVELESKDQNLGQEFGAVSGSLSIDWKGEEITMQQAGKILQSTNREERKEAFDKMADKRLEQKEKLDGILDKMVEVRSEIARNAGFDNYRDFKFKAMGRFDYTPEDCFDFHKSVREVVVPLVTEQKLERKEKLGLDSLKPWDLAVDPEGKEPLRPFEKGEDLLKTTKKVFGKLDPFFAECLEKMDQMGHLDLDSKSGKAPGGYNYPLYESGAPFIFMNAVGSQRDLVTMVHEGGHAVHSFLSHHFKLLAFKGLTSEIAELASMSMELLTMDYWNEFYSNEEELKRAKIDHLEDIIAVFPWIMQIDRFQHWMYTHPKHTHEERHDYWLTLSKEFGDDETDWSGYEEYRNIVWQKQLHIFEVPFYYIEYAMAQLGALAIWRNYKQNPQKAIEKYKAALSLGYSKTIGEVYEEAGIKFDFSENYVRELVQFVQGEIEALKK